ncbi:hypothetical protein JCM33374_g447 [Metschnikowia sp. JCM 33374]|nr:hypothetical protein JCM33374_g447 [Metschnikowia sp. JCM 33374]
MSVSLRRRISSARDLLRPSENHNSLALLARETMLKYREKLQPIFPTEFFEKLESFDGESDAVDHRKSNFMLRHSLSVPMVTVANLHVQPGDPNFTLWLFISAYFPIIAACMAPLGNLISLIGLLEHWQIDPATDQTLPDSHPAYALNIVSFILGILGNVSLLMNFSGRLHYLLAQCVTISCFAVATICLIVAVLLANWRIHHYMLVASEGFWLAIFTIGMYAFCTVVLVVNVVGYKLNKYRASFNLDKKQRSLMSHTIAFSVWQAVGTVVMVTLIPEMAYGSSLYYCTVSMLTIGLGDIVPMTAGAKVFALFFSLVGVLIMGLIISTLRQVILYSAGPSLFWHHIERKRIELVQKLQENQDKEVTASETFAMMRTIRSKVTLSQQRRVLAITLLIFISFWLVGAVIFQSVESWSYFNALYFCFLCLLTIGYGDFHPDTALGRVFFIVWAIAAVPLMTILISNLGDTLFEISDRLDFFTGKLFHLDTYMRMFMGKSYASEVMKSKEHSKVVEEAVENNDAYPRTKALAEDIDARADELQDVDIRYVEQMNLTLGIHDSLVLLRQIFADATDLPEKEYDFEEWAKHLRHLENTDAEADDFWIGDRSPLRLPLKEANYLLMKSLMKIDKDLQKLVKVQNEVFLSSVNDTIEDEQSTEDGTSGSMSRSISRVSSRVSSTVNSRDGSSHAPKVNDS